ncbi:GNAT family N-acetyltransferase [Streptomyces sp. NBC_00237]|uniref:GNAT family N-acetyltransferase n=1 Tax=Streptomyces sp. NBC_00237 TaxID=2975687 RepID=UPI0022572A69|nr:GNAT family N-acetyltransferase [Streptomyces sp. NBC_00237]MCX5205404.1 GNAT family N-acetyltransferase [Streptomyces sp. NBC_00237]
MTFRTTFRSTVEADLDRLLPLLVADPASSLSAHTYLSKLADGQYRHAWTWIAEDPSGGDTAPLAVAVWWGLPSEATPGALDAVYVDEARVPTGQRVALAAELLAAAHAAFKEAGAAEAPAFHIFVPGDYRDRPEVAEALAWRQEAARAAGLVGFVERLGYEWTPQGGLREAASPQLVFAAEPDDEVFVELFRQVLQDTLDASTRAEAEQIGAEAQARNDVAFYQEQMAGERSWWRVARNAAGEAVGFGLPSRNLAGPVVGYLGVLPGHRGLGHVDEILAEITAILAAEPDTSRIRADTDLANRPMAAAFERAGYRNFRRRLVLSARL